MTREAALHQFFSSFGMQAFLSTTVPDDVKYPWLTYEGTSGNWEDQVNIAVTLWFHTDSESVPNAKVRAISEAIGVGGKVITYDNGKMWIKRGTPWCLSITDQADSTVKGKQLNLYIEDWRI